MKAWCRGLEEEGEGGREGEVEGREPCQKGRER